MNDTDRHLWKMGELVEIDSYAWLGVDEASELLGLGPRQLARRAQDGLIEKRTLPKAKGEKAARVVYSRADIEAVKAGKPVISKTDAKSLTAEALGLTLPDLAEALKAEKLRVIEATASLAVSVAETDALIKSLAPVIAHARENPPMPPMEDIVAALAERLVLQLHPDFASLAAAIRDGLSEIAKVAAALPPPLRPYLKLAEAVDYSGLPAAFLVQAARAGTIRAVNVGSGKREFWRFAREALAR